MSTSAAAELGAARYGAAFVVAVALACGVACGRPMDVRASPPAAENSIGPLQFDAQGANFRRWVDAFKAEVYKSWSAATMHPDWNGLQVQVRFVVQRSGAVSQAEVQASSGNDEFDKEAETALLRAAPFPPLPSTFPSDALEADIWYRAHLQDRQ